MVQLRGAHLFYITKCENVFLGSVQCWKSILSRYMCVFLPFCVNFRNIININRNVRKWFLNNKYFN